MTDIDVRTVFVAGGTGTTGRRVAARLEARGIRTRIGSRTAATPFDWADDRTWGPALDGVDAAYLGGATEFPVAVAFVARAVEAGVRRLVLLSARGVTTPGYYDDQAVLADGIVAWERALAGSGIAWAVLRPGWFQQNFDEVDFADAVRAGVLRLPFDDGRAAFIDADDIADVAVAALLDGALDGAAAELTGPEGLGVRDAVGRVARAAGRDIRYDVVDPAQYRADVIAHGADERTARIALAALSPIADGREGETTGEVDRILGRRAGSFDGYLARVTAAGGWPGDDAA